MGLRPQCEGFTGRAGARPELLLLACELPQDLQDVNHRPPMFQTERTIYGDDVSLAVRSSATAEDSPDSLLCGPKRHLLKYQQ